MKTRNLLVMGAVTASAVTAINLVKRYQVWKREEIARLYAGSCWVETTLGPVEYQTVGQGPAVLIAHGSPGGYDQGLAFTNLLGTQNFTFISISRPGYLRTPLAAGKTPEAQADLYAALLDKLGIQRAAIIGISGGGPSAIQFALRHSERCRGLVMVSAVTQRYSEEEFMRSLPLDRLLFKRLSDKLLLFDPFLYLLLGLAKWQPDTIAPEDFLHSITMNHLRRVGFDNDMQQFATMEMYRLEEITAPTFALHGTMDIDVSYADAELLARKVPQTTLLTIEGGNHLSFLTHKERVIPALRDFLQAL